MDDEGYSSSEIAKVLLLSDEAIRKHLIDYHASSKLKPENGSNYSKLTDEQEKKLAEHLEINNYVYASQIGLYIKNMAFLTVLRVLSSFCID